MGEWVTDGVRAVTRMDVPALLIALAIACALTGAAYTFARAVLP